MDSQQIFHHMGLMSLLFSSLSIAALAIVVPLVYVKVDYQRLELSEYAGRFRQSSAAIWSEMFELRESMDHQRPLFSRRQRRPWLESGLCRGCFTLACSMGPPGPPGPPGTDGIPGEPGQQGAAGADGFDVQLESEPDLPCVVCPSGPPGLRGPQGERGLSGRMGTKGEAGPDGKSGSDGPPGNPGMPGVRGEKGPMGSKGPEGERAIAGVGVKGPIGPPGPMGMKGRPGPHGKTSNNPGALGSPGPAGPPGPVGEQGALGMEGPYGPPGDPGMPASYCPSDCGVQNILADMVPSLKNRGNHNKYAPPPDQPLDENAISPPMAKYASINDDGYSNRRLHDFSTYERKLRRKLLRKLLKKRIRRL